MNKYRLWLFLITLIALALRLYNLTYHSLWFDEAISVHWARQTIPRILEVGFTLVEDRLPPLYYLLLKGWTALVGFSEVGVRSLSVVLGTLLIPVVASVAVPLFNRRVALVTALLIALNPFLIWYSQEARMYAPAVFFSALTVWAFLRASQSANERMANGEWPRTTVNDEVARPTSYASRITHHASRFTLHASRSTLHALYLLLFTLFALAGLYTHLYTGFVLPALGLWLVISYPRQWRVWLPFVFSGLIIALAFTPLALATWRFSGETTPGDPFTGLGQRAWWLLQAFTIWKAPLSPAFRIAIPTIIAIFALAAYLKPRSSAQPPFGTLHAPRSTLHASVRSLILGRFPHPLLLVTLLLITPLVIANLLLLRNHLAFFGERYFIVMVPWLLLLAAIGADRLSEWMNPKRRLRTGEWRMASERSSRLTFHVSRFTLHAPRFTSYLPFILLFSLTALPIPGHWSVATAKEAWRQSAAYLAEHAAPNHGILIHPDWVRYPFQFYFHGPGQTYAAFSNVTPETSLDGPLQGVVSNHPVIWLIQSHLNDPDPNHLVEQWFAARYPLITELYPPGISLKGYAPGYQLDTLPPEATPTNIQFDNGLHLVGYQADRVVSATDEFFHPPSGWAHVILYWTASEPLKEDVAPFVNLVGPEGVWGASLERATDALKFYPTSRWPVGYPIIRHDLDVNLNPVTPPGAYQLVVGLPGAAQEEYPLAEIEVR